MYRLMVCRIGLMFAIASAILLSCASSVYAGSLKVRALIAPANAGYVGVTQADPAIAPTTRDSSGYRVLVPGFSTVRADKSVKWFPAVDAGVIVWWDADSHQEDSMGFGFGGHLVTYKVQDDTRFSPALTMHFGSRTKQLFAGVLFTQAGDVRLPGGSGEVNVPIGHEHDFDVPRGGSPRTRNFYAGIVLGALNTGDK